VRAETAPRSYAAETPGLVRSSAAVDDPCVPADAISLYHNRCLEADRLADMAARTPPPPAWRVLYFGRDVASDAVVTPEAAVQSELHVEEAAALDSAYQTAPPLSPGDDLLAMLAHIGSTIFSLKESLTVSAAADAQVLSLHGGNQHTLEPAAAALPPQRGAPPLLSFASPSAETPGDVPSAPALFASLAGLGAAIGSLSDELAASAAAGAPVDPDVRMLPPAQRWPLHAERASPSRAELLLAHAATGHPVEPAGGSVRTSAAARTPGLSRAQQLLDAADAA
jgi:hypothetical protein